MLTLMERARRQAEERMAKVESDAVHEQYERPMTRGECGEQRPCPWVGCRHHLYLEIHPETGNIKLNFPDKEVWDMAETCSLDVADKGGVTLAEVGAVYGVTRERIRQLEARAMQVVEQHAKRLAP